MRVATPGEKEHLTRITPALIEVLRNMRAEHAFNEGTLRFLRRSGVPKPAASVALCTVDKALGIQNARALVDDSQAYATWPEADEHRNPLQEFLEQAASAA